MKYVVASATCIQLCCYFILAKILQFSVTSFSELAALPYLVVVLNIRDKVVIYDETRWPIYMCLRSFSRLRFQHQFTHPTIFRNRNPILWTNPASSFPEMQKYKARVICAQTVAHL